MHDGDSDRRSRGRRGGKREFGGPQDFGSDFGGSDFGGDYGGGRDGGYRGGRSNDFGGGYGRDDLGLPEWGNRHADDPSYDRKAWTADPYRRCCTANAWHGFVLAARIMGMRDAWDHPPLFDYVDRYMQVEQQGHWMRSWSPFCERMWDRYRGAF